MRKLNVATLLVLVVVLSVACTPSQVAAVDKAAVAAEPLCEAALRFSEAAELAPLCALEPEAVAAIAELVEEHLGQPGMKASPPGQPWTPTRADVHRRIAKKRAAKGASK